LTADNPWITSAVDVELDELYESYENDLQAYADTIGEYHMNDSVYRFLVQNETMGAELFYLLQNEGIIESDDDALRELMQSDTFVRVKQILISDTNGKTDEENLALIQDIYSQLENGGDFETLLGMYGQDLYMFNNDDGYYIAPGSRYTEFEEAAFSLEVGEYSGIVKTLAGYSIIMRYEKDQEYLDTHFDELCQEYYDGAYNTILEAHAASLTMTPLPALDNYTILTME
ncbi:MAG: peptidylprolyl isomerase, partial [Clostridia bacterium]|nr:peptidylprolyl isomerase [Clostridia bacterium]